jgi:hypothetical protein
MADADELARDLHERKAVEKIRAAATLLAEAGSHLGKDEARTPVDRWYACNALYHGAIKWLDDWEPGR